MPRNIVICCDGTGNDFVTDTTNVLRLYRMLERDGQQIAYYDAGVGTMVDPAAISVLRKSLSRKLDAAIGLRVRENVISAYRFLARTYQAGDHIYLFGFSRGSYTIRALAGMIHFLGVVRPELEHLAPLAWSVYANEAAGYEVSPRFAGGNRFHRSFGVMPKPAVHFVGAWDTVSSFGWIWNFQTLPHTSVNPSITHFRHAMAIDERRAMFPALRFFPNESQQANCKQVWFPGVHSDVGGGYPEQEASLAKVSLAWMLREAVGLRVNAAEQRHLMDSRDKPPPDPLGPIHDSLTGFWKPFEWVPRRFWNNDAKRMRWHGPHCGRARPILEGSVLHVSVIERMKGKPGYAPRNLPKVHSVET